MQEIILIDSTAIWSFVLAHYLKHAGYKVTVQRSIEQSIEHSTRQHISAIVYDTEEYAIEKIQQDIQKLTHIYAQPTPVIALVKQNISSVPLEFGTQIELPVHASQLYHVITQLVQKSSSYIREY